MTAITDAGSGKAEATADPATPGSRTTATPQEHPATDPAAAKAAAQASAKAAAAALKDLIAPARPAMVTGVALQILGSIATIAPYIGMAELAKLFIAAGAAQAGDTTPPTGAVAGPDPAQVWLIATAVILALVARTVLSGAALSITHFADARWQGIVRERIVDRLGRVPLGWFTRNSAGTVRKATQTDIGDVHYLIAHGAVETAAALTVPVVGVGYLALLDWRLALLGLVTIFIHLITYAVMTRDITEKMAEMHEGIARISTTIVEFVAGISVVKSFGQAGRAHEAYRKAAIGFGEAYGNWVRPMLRTSTLASIPITAPFVLLINLAVGSWFVASGWVSIIDLITAALVATTIPAAIMTLSFGMQARREASAAAGRLTELLATPVLPQPAHPAVPASSEVRFDGVSFSYDGKTSVLRDIDLTLAPGSVTALVGASGSGKSTLATLVARFADVAAGSVSIGGVDVRDIDSDELYRLVSFVLQDVQLLQASVADNIRLGRPEASIEEVMEAARLAQIDTRILALPRGYDSVVGTDALFSGGEAQRVSIARAILADPQILVLDEATAFADPESEAQIQAAIANLVGGRTILVIAHRLASIVTADQIVVLDHGEITEIGTHTTLLAHPGAYARMWRAYEGDLS